MATLYGPHVTLPHVGHRYQQFRTPERSMDKYMFRVWPGSLKYSPVGVLSTLLTEILHCFFKIPVRSALPNIFSNFLNNLCAFEFDQGIREFKQLKYQPAYISIYKNKWEHGFTRSLN